MQILFVDESGTPPPPDKEGVAQYFILGGIVIPEDLWGKVDESLRMLKKEFNVQGEVKWRYFAPQKGAKSNSLSHLDAAAKEALRLRLYALITSFKSIKLLGVATNVAAAYKLRYIRSSDDLYWYSYKQLTERFQYYLQDLERTVGSKINGIIVCDHRAPKDDERLRELHQALVSGEKFNASRYSNLIEGLFIAPSHLSVGIQLADMIAGAMFRVTKEDYRYYNLIKESFRKSPSGRVEGYGIVRFPKPSN